MTVLPTIRQALAWAQNKLGACDTPRLDAELLLAHVLRVERVHLFTHDELLVSLTDWRAYQALVEQRFLHVPVAYLLGQKEFYGLSLRVTQQVLIPRPDTECLVDGVHVLLQGHGSPLVADIGTGSGAIALALKSLLPSARVVGIDRSRDALRVAQGNGRSLSLAVHWLHSDGLQAIVPHPVFDVVASNPPYIPQADITNLPADVLQEPLAALEGGPDGLVFVRRFAEEATLRLRCGGWFVVEVGDGQAQQATAVLQQQGYADIQMRRDASGTDRVVSGRWTKRW